MNSGPFGDIAYLRSVLIGPVTILFTKLNGHDGHVWFQEFQKFLKKMPCWTESITSEFTTWKEVNIASHSRRANLERAIAKARNQSLEEFKASVNDEIELAFIAQVSVNDTADVINVARITSTDLGLSDGSSTAELLQIAGRYGLVPCPQETAFQLQIQYPGLLAEKHRCVVVTEPVIKSSRHWVLELSFRFHNRKEKCLSILPAEFHPDRTWTSDTKFVFMKSKT